MNLKQAIEQGNLKEVKRIFENALQNFRLHGTFTGEIIKLEHEGINPSKLHLLYNEPQANNIISPLMLAILLEQEEIIEYILNISTSEATNFLIRSKDAAGFNPLHYAAYKGNIEVYQALYNNIAITNTTNVPYVAIAIANKDLDTVRSLLKFELNNLPNNINFLFTKYIDYAASLGTLDILKETIFYNKKFLEYYIENRYINSVTVRIMNIEIDIAEIIKNSCDIEILKDLIDAEYHAENPNGYQHIKLTNTNPYSLAIAYRSDANKIVDEFLKNDIPVESNFAEEMLKLFTVPPMEGENTFIDSDECLDTLKKILVNNPNVINENVVSDINSNKTVINTQGSINTEELNTNYKKHIELMQMVKIGHEVLASNFNFGIKPLSKDFGRREFTKVIEGLAKSTLPTKFEHLESIKFDVAEEITLDPALKICIDNALTSLLTPMYDLDAILIAALIPGFAGEAKEFEIALTPVSFPQALEFGVDTNEVFDFDNNTRKYTLKSSYPNATFAQKFFGNNPQYQTPGEFTLENLEKIPSILEDSVLTLDQKVNLISLLQEIHFEHYEAAPESLTKIKNDPSIENVLKKYKEFITKELENSQSEEEDISIYDQTPASSDPTEETLVDLVGNLNLNKEEYESIYDQTPTSSSYPNEELADLVGNLNLNEEKE